MPSIATIAQEVYNQAIQGSELNPTGVPDALARLIVAQTKFETAKEIAGKYVPYQSNAFILNNNAIGYKWVGSYYQVGKGIQSSEGDYYGQYADYTASIKELIDWIYRRRAEGKFPWDLGLITTPKGYATYLKNAGYFADSIDNYANGLQAWSGSAKAAGNGIGLLGWALIAAAGVTIANYSKKHSRK